MPKMKSSLKPLGSPLAAIQVTGARTHNLKSVNVNIPHDRITVITGPSGCGKSSLAIDTIFAEGQRQFMETLSTYTRQFLDQMEPADVDEISGLLPTLKIDQHTGTAGPRSTVGTITEIHDYLRILYARVGEIRCQNCGEPIGQQTPTEIVNWIMSLPEGTRLMVMAPLVRGRKGKHADVFERVRAERLVRVRVNGQVVDIDDAPELETKRSHDVDAITDRIVVREGVESRLLEAIDLALKLTSRLVSVSYLTRSESDSEDWQEKLFSTDLACARCDVSYPEVEPRTFSFNSPYGACPTCQGLGQFEQFDPERVVPDRERSLESGAVEAWQGLSRTRLQKHIDALKPTMDRIKLAADVPLSKLSEAKWKQLWEGAGKQAPGLLTQIEKEWATALDPRVYESLEAARSIRPCPDCNGSRLGPIAHSVTIDGQSIIDVTAKSIVDAERFFADCSAQRNEIAVPLLTEIIQRCHYLNQVGLSYLTLARSGQTLSGGELQRVRLASAIGSGQVNVCFVLDEPTIGLHNRDNDRLIQAICRLRDSGNTVVIVEHDESVMQMADQLIDIGPGAGENGGTIVAAGTPADVRASRDSLTGQYLSGRKRITVPAQRREARGWMEIKGAAGNNLQNIDVRFPLGTFVCISGVSGSGKSTLVNRTLAPALHNHFFRGCHRTEPYQLLSGLESIDKFVEIDQRPIGRNSRSCPATYSGVMNELRKIFAATKEAKRLGFTAARFSFNSGKGRCSECNGLGEKVMEMNFLPDISITCSACHGRRYNPATLAVKYRDHSIADVLTIPILDSAQLFSEHPRINQIMQSLLDVGLGYLRLGQSASTLSGGEAQRIKLATELATKATGNTLYLLDEPTTGLHFEDVQRLLDLLNRLVDKGNSVITVEHHLDVLKCADWLIDLGPDGGVNGGQVVAVGTPEQVAQNSHSQTGRYLGDLHRP
ncbi:MAG: excinuclease ABC subunit UvrA [Pirellulaceae bacterium]